MYIFTHRFATLLVTFLSVALCSCASRHRMHTMRPSELFDYIEKLSPEAAERSKKQMTEQDRLFIAIRLLTPCFELKTIQDFLIVGSLDPNLRRVANEDFADYWIIEPFQKNRKKTRKLVQLCVSVIDNICRDATIYTLLINAKAGVLIPLEQAKPVLDYIGDIWPVSHVVFCMEPGKSDDCGELMLIMESIRTAVVIHNKPNRDSGEMDSYCWRKRWTSQIFIRWDDAWYSTHALSRSFSDKLIRTNGSGKMME